MENKGRTLEGDIEFNYKLQDLIDFDKYTKEDLMSEDDIDSLNMLDFVEYLVNESNEVHVLSTDIIRKIYLVTSYYLYDYSKVTPDIRNRCHNIITLTNRLVAGNRDFEKIENEIQYRVRLDDVSYITEDMSSSYETDISLYDYLNEVRNYELSNVNTYKKLIKNPTTITSIISVMNKHLFELTARDIEKLRDVIGYKIVLFNDCQNQLELDEKAIAQDGTEVEVIYFDDRELADIIKCNDIKSLENLYHVLDNYYENIRNIEQSLDPEKLMRK